MAPAQVVSRRDVPADFVADFVNTRADGGGHVELFGDARALREWGITRGVLDPDAPETVFTESDVVAAHELREAMRTVLRSHVDDPDLADTELHAAEDHLLRAGARYPLAAVVTADGAALSAANAGGPGVFASVLAALVETSLSGEWPRVKVCSFDQCRFAFVDRTRNRSGRFCCTNCASRVSMRAVRARRSAT